MGNHQKPVSGTRLAALQLGCNLMTKGQCNPECSSLLCSQVDKADLCKLCVHKLPALSSSSPSDVAAAVKATLAAASREAGHESAAAAVEAATIEQPGDSSKQLLFLVFQHAGVANEVFAALPGATVLLFFAWLSCTAQCLHCLRHACIGTEYG
jgi:hypothetical protein